MGKKTLALMGIVENGNEDEESDEIIFMSGSEDENGDESGVVDVMELDSDDERRIDAEINMEFKAKTPPKWDVESVLSTRTNHENHPMEVKVNAIVKKDKEMKMDSNMMDIAENEVMIGMIEEKMEKVVDEKKVDFDFGSSFSFGNIAQNNEKNVEIIQDDEKKQIVFEFGSFVEEDDAKRNGFVDSNVHVDDSDSGDDVDEKQVNAY